MDPNINPDPGQTGYLFILTNPGAGPWNLTITFNPGGQQVVPGVQQGNGSIHFIAYSIQSNNTPPDPLGVWQRLCIRNDGLPVDLNGL